MPSDLRTEIWVTACLRSASNLGIGAYVVRRGGHDRCTVLLKINMLENGCRVLTQVRDIDGKLSWMDPYEGQGADEAKIDAYLKRSAERDPDVWVIEVEDRQGRNPFSLT